MSLSVPLRKSLLSKGGLHDLMHPTVEGQPLAVSGVSAAAYATLIRIGGDALRAYGLCDTFLHGHAMQCRRGEGRTWNVETP